ncbi:MAG: HAMP domain-containing histidine kinase [Candidatus Omnitrophica bacterium]|nr:HAMP domain-containing histidine kinase [Candidatus Omnitrophota bacterium]MCF7877268.1 HAMP domain-containing histidine kinase [Candidatus Omnitrophota bacterium]MCF7878666.1 HAMP domain-containing histidine kinase [Candidatus Omnitrophota bacterium]MCF7893368.1 HAMP domain-containing histidine kinase [Candidatus Omnitrophota bacterium]
MIFQKKKSKNDYKIIVSELKDNPLRKIKICFALMAIIPFLVLFYLLIGKNFLYRLFLGANGLIIGIAIFISLLGFLIAYQLIVNMVKKLLFYFLEKRRADEEKLEIISGFSHDLKTPLAVIRTGLQNMVDGVAGVLDKTQQRMASICIKALDRATSFINQIFELAKLKITISNLNRELVDFKYLVKNELSEIAALADKNSQKLSCRILSADSKIWGDKEKLSRVIMNLLSNAVKYADEKGRIDVALSSDSDVVKLAVINTGPGIPQDKLDKVFAKYQRVSPRAKVEGAGLGLSLVKDIIELHKGYITVKSIPNKETEFKIILPRDLRVSTRSN